MGAITITDVEWYEGRWLLISGQILKNVGER